MKQYALVQLDLTITANDCKPFVLITLFSMNSFDSFPTSYFRVRLLSVLRGHSVFSSPQQRPMTSDLPDFIHYIFFPIVILTFLNSTQTLVFWLIPIMFTLSCHVLLKLCLYRCWVI